MIAVDAILMNPLPKGMSVVATKFHNVGYGIITVSNELCEGETTFA